jgi:hypothetical protein
MGSGPILLRVTLRIDGGLAHFPGLAKPIELDDAQLGLEGAAQMRRLCEGVCAAPAPPGLATNSPHPDGRRYRLTVEVEGSRREVVAADPVDTPAIAELIAFVEEHGRR